ncbi:hypothetical protein B0H67DRAFT_569580 [Lasiosphaeris hirsuta]|uniref:Rhodopsin domain-containing protein n=1 Tax=Lasiosphaeris hirsuta TaxID=260670 RepID=A0AA40E7B4_9PEZI|nr:hypothetical protein B0H67DRAFT_569580 [Lasiosphaeris hirsuta]
MDSGELPTDDDKGPMLLATVHSLHTIVIVVYLIRLWSRLRPKFALTAADYTITIALVAKTVSVVLTTMAVSHGFGRHAIYIDRSGLAVLGNELFFVFIAGSLATGFARISIACLLLQVTMSRKWRIGMWSTIAAQALFMTIYCIVQLAQCQSAVSKNINIKQTQCLTPEQVSSFSYASMGISMFSDLICAIIPGFLVRILTRSLVEKILTFTLLASCLLASLLGVAKIYYTATFDFASTDGFYLMVDKFLWSRLEEAVIMIAACAPLLRVPVERALRRLGFSGFEVPTREFNIASLGSSVKDNSGWVSESQRSGGRRVSFSQAGSRGGAQDPELGRVTMENI